MIEADAQGEACTVALVERKQAFADFGTLHWLHGVGEDEHLEAARQGVFSHRQHVRVQERLAAGEADLACFEAKIRNFVEEG